MAASVNPLFENALRETVADWLRRTGSGGVVSCPLSTPLRQVLLLCHTHQIRFVPLMDQTSAQVRHGVDVSDIVHYIGKAVRSAGQAGEAKAQQEAIDKALAVPASEAAGCSSRNSFATLLPTATMGDALHLLLGNSKRLVVVDPALNLAPVAILSRAKMLVTLASHLANFPLEPRTLHDLHIGNHQVTVLRAEQSFLEAVLMMEQNNISSVGVTGENNKLIGVLSTSEIKLLASDVGTSLLQQSLQTVLEYKHTAYRNATYPVISVRPTCTLGTAVSKMTTSRLHRLLVVDDDHCAISVLSMLDLLKLLVQ